MEQPKQHDLSQDVEAALGAMQLALIKSTARIRDLERLLQAAEAEAESLRSEARARGNVVAMPDAA